MGKNNILMDFTAVAALATGLIMLGSCATAPIPVAVANEAALHEKASQLAGELALEPRDEAAVADGIKAFLGELADEYGTEFIAALPRIRRPGDLNEYLVDGHETTTSRTMVEAFMDWDRSRKNEKWDERTAVRTETEHFTILTMAGSAAHREREFIARSCEVYLESSTAFLKPDEASAARFHANRASLSGGKVTVMLPQSSRSLRSSAGRTGANYAFSVGKENEVLIQATIILPYYNALSTMALAHEIVHVRDFLQRIDLSSAPITPEARDGEASASIAKFKSWANATFEKVVPNDRAFGEGVAEYLTARMNPIQGAFYLNADEALRALGVQVTLLRDILTPPVVEKDPRLRLVRYIELHSFIDFLIAKYGEERFLDFYQRVPPNEANFISAYGTDFAGMQTRWKEALR